MVQQVPYDVAVGVRTNVYVDGFNLYYGALKSTPFKWLDLRKLAQGLLHPENEIRRIRYFTAKVTPRDGDPTLTERQAAYLRALGTIPNLEIHFGAFLTNPARLPLADGSGMAWVMRTEEKGSDVNLATHLLMDAFDDDFDTALVISNDSDLVEPMRLVRMRFGKTVGVACPVIAKGRFPSQHLVKSSDFSAHITEKRKALVRRSQFPKKMKDDQGSFSKPPLWE